MARIGAHAPGYGLQVAFMLALGLRPPAASATPNASPAFSFELTRDKEAEAYPDQEILASEVDKRAASSGGTRATVA